MTSKHGEATTESPFPPSASDFVESQHAFGRLVTVDVFPARSGG